MTVRRPPLLPPGGRIGVVSLASPVPAARLESGVAALRALGYGVEVGEHALARDGHHAGVPIDRASDLNEMFARSDIDAIFCARGGSSAILTLEHLDFKLAGAHPKVFVGYSDITSVQLALWARAGLPSFFGPMVTPEWAGGLTPEAGALLWRLIGHASPAGPLVDRQRATAPWALVGGRAAGVLVGGTLALVAATLGTPEQIDLTDRIFFFEDIHESPARIERYLAQLGRAGLLRQAAGFLVGPLRWDASLEEQSAYRPFEAALRDHLAPLGRPVLAGYPFGHVANPITLPLGTMVELDADERVLRVVEAAVCLPQR